MSTAWGQFGITWIFQEHPRFAVNSRTHSPNACPKSANTSLTEGHGPCCQPPNTCMMELNFSNNSRLVISTVNSEVNDSKDEHTVHPEGCLKINYSVVFTKKAVSLCSLLSNLPVGFWNENFLSSGGFVRNNYASDAWEHRGFTKDLTGTILEGWERHLSPKQDGHW